MWQLITVVLCGIYILCPIDFIPEALLGPFGLVDDFVAGLFATSVGLLWKKRKGDVSPELTEELPPILNREPPILLED